MRNGTLVRPATPHCYLYDRPVAFREYIAYGNYKNKFEGVGVIVGREETDPGEFVASTWLKIVSSSGVGWVKFKELDEAQ